MVDLVQPGDILFVRPGEQIPVDAVVTEIHASINEAMLAGETLHKEKAGSKVLTGTLTISGRVLFAASCVGKDTVLAQIFQLVQGAQGVKSLFQNFADYITCILVPSALGIATFVFSGGSGGQNPRYRIPFSSW